MKKLDEQFNQMVNSVRALVGLQTVEEEEAAAAQRRQEVAIKQVGDMAPVIAMEALKATRTPR